MRKKFQLALLRHYKDDKELAKQFIKEVRDLGLDISDEEVIKKIHNRPEQLALLITYSDLGMLRKIGESMNALKPTK